MDWQSKGVDSVWFGGGNGLIIGCGRKEVAVNQSNPWTGYNIGVADNTTNWHYNEYAYDSATQMRDTSNMLYDGHLEYDARARPWFQRGWDVRVLHCFCLPYTVSMSFVCVNPFVSFVFGAVSSDARCIIMSWLYVGSYS